ncbi:MoxR family ATPase [soil metagenome]
MVPRTALDDPSVEELDIGVVREASQRIAGNIERVIEGKPEVVRLAILVMLAEGHLLIEDVPGVGKTKLAKALARSIDSSVRRIQFTPDLLPSDVTGVSIYNQEEHDFEFKPGAVFANLVVGDEINRASPKTQSALLECMEEQQVTVDGTTYKLEAPFMVLATQNPIEMEGTYPLPEAQRDRFTARVSMGYPDVYAEMAMLSGHTGSDPLDDLAPVSSAGEVRALIHAVRRSHVSDGVRKYIVDLVNATRRSPELRLGGSPRASLHLLRTAKAAAAVAGRAYVLPDDVQQLAGAVLSHRVILNPDAQIARRSADAIIADVVRAVPVPRAPDQAGMR